MATQHMMQADKEKRTAVGESLGNAINQAKNLRTHDKSAEDQAVMRLVGMLEAALDYFRRKIK